MGRHLSALRTFFAFLKREGRVDGNPAKTVGTPRQDKTLPRTLSVSEATAVVETKGREGALGLRDRALLELLYATGLRVSELVGLRLEDVDLSARQLRTVGKGRKERVVPFGQPAAAAVRAWLKARGAFQPNARDAEMVFLNARAGRLTDRSVRRVLDRAVQEAAHFRGPALHDRGSHRHLAVAAERDEAVSPDAEDRRVREPRSAHHGRV